tara:strand:- start:570 stop:674 length:105 start_codon:yes stop_codon:yes gene_type:complete
MRASWDASSNPTYIEGTSLGGRVMQVERAQGTLA